MRANVRPSTGFGAVTTNLEGKLAEDLVSVFDFLTDLQRADVASFTGLIDVTAAINNAIAVDLLGQIASERVGFQVAGGIIVRVLQRADGRHLRRQAHHPRRRDGAERFELMRPRTEVGDPRTAQPINLGHGFADQHVLRRGSKVFQGLARAGVFHVGFVYPDAGVCWRATQRIRQLRARDVLTRRAVRVDQDDEVVAIAHRRLQPIQVHREIIARRKWQAVHRAADNLLQHVCIFAVGGVENERVRVGTEPVPQGTEDEVGGAGSRQNVRRLHTVGGGDGLNQAFAGRRR